MASKADIKHPHPHGVPDWEGEDHHQPFEQAEHVEEKLTRVMAVIAVVIGMALGLRVLTG